MLRLWIALAGARVARLASRVARRGGTAFPGLVALWLDPRIVEKLSGTIPGGVVLVTGTNGKTTTTKMLSTILAATGRRVLTNRTGSNLARGLATTLVAATRRGHVQADLAVFEVDEAAVRDLGPRIHPRLVVVTNLARDQLDRYGELETTAGFVATGLVEAAGSILNGDDPMVARLATAGADFFGAVDAIRATMPSDGELYGEAATESPTAVAALITGVRRREEGQMVAMLLDGHEIEVELRLPGSYNAYNAAAAMLAAARLGAEPMAAVQALAAMPPAFGRGQVIPYRGRRVTLLLVKNPAGLNQAIRLLGDTEATSVLIAINDLHADGRDVSWLWDAAVEDLAATGHRFGAGGLRAADMALRLKYAGVDAWVEPDAHAALDRVVEDTPDGGMAYVVPTYTAMLEFLELLRPGVSLEEAWS